MFLPNVFYYLLYPLLHAFQCIPDKLLATNACQDLSFETVVKLKIAQCVVECVADKHNIGTQWRNQSSHSEYFGTIFDNTSSGSTPSCCIFTFSVYFIPK
ncbi:hypothetical protein PUN28_016790 [Cardiocondyla obscurior]|uniref:Secreted protein n=1 Tax=Cardiocondyla obscurior TaxID=286306 RepID=A0AAW2ERF3_9HYME